MEPLLHVVHLSLCTPRQISLALRRVRLSREQAHDDHTVLFFCDLPDASAAQSPDDAALIRCVQSGVMSMSARRPGQYFFLVRGRARDATLCRWLGRSQPQSARQALARLLLGEPSPAPLAANFSSVDLHGRFVAALFTDGALAFSPDAPARMLAALRASGEPALRGRLLIPYRREEPVLVRLLRERFSLHPSLPGDMPAPLVAIYRINALSVPPPAIQADCTFVLTTPPTLAELFSDAAVQGVRAPALRLSLAPARLFVLLLFAFWGNSFAALLVVLLPECYAFLHPRRLPGALVRLSFLPRMALLSVNALLNRRLSSKRFRVSLACGDASCVIFGGALLLLALHGVGALAALLPVSLLWLCAPMIDHALALPTRERIPLNAAQQASLRAMAKHAFLAISPQSVSPAHLLCTCAGCMLDLLEPDEAARRAEGMLDRCAIKTPFDVCCLLASAQFFCEQMAQCDAALRPLPARIEAKALAARIAQENTPLAVLLHAATSRQPTPQALDALRQAKSGSPMDALFLPPDWLPDQDAPLVLTHPHTFLRQQARASAPKEKNDPPADNSQSNRFLVLSCAALGSPFHALLLRSACIAPYTPLLDLM